MNMLRFTNALYIAELHLKVGPELLTVPRDRVINIIHDFSKHTITVTAYCKNGICTM